jgi:hypothetical protein
MAQLRKLKRVTRRKKLARKSRRRQSGGANIILTCTLNPTSGAISVTSSDPTVTTTTAKNTITLMNLNGNIKNITFAGPTGVSVPTSKVGMSASDTGIRIKDLSTKKVIVPSTSYGYTKPLVASAQTKLNSAVGASFPNGLEISNLNTANLGATGSGDAKFTITIGM